MLWINMLNGFLVVYIFWLVSRGRKDTMLCLFNPLRIYLAPKEEFHKTLWMEDELKGTHRCVKI